MQALAIIICKIFQIIFYLFKERIFLCCTNLCMEIIVVVHGLMKLLQYMYEYEYCNFSIICIIIFIFVNHAHLITYCFVISLLFYFPLPVKRSYSLAKLLLLLMLIHIELILCALVPFLETKCRDNFIFLIKPIDIKLNNPSL